MKIHMKKYFTIVTTLALSSSLALANEGLPNSSNIGKGSVVLVSKPFQPMNSNEPWMVYYFNKTCQACINFRNIWDELTKEPQFNGLNFGSLDCSTDREGPCANIQSFPRLTGFHKGQVSATYNGKFDRDNVANFFTNFAKVNNVNGIGGSGGPMVNQQVKNQLNVNSQVYSQINNNQYVNNNVNTNYFNNQGNSRQPQHNSFTDTLTVKTGRHTRTSASSCRNGFDNNQSPFNVGNRNFKDAPSSSYDKDDDSAESRVGLDDDNTNSPVKGSKSISDKDDTKGLFQDDSSRDGGSSFSKHANCLQDADNCQSNQCHTNHCQSNHCQFNHCQFNQCQSNQCQFNRCQSNQCHSNHCLFNHCQSNHCQENCSHECNNNCCNICHNSCPPEGNDYNTADINRSNEENSGYGSGNEISSKDNTPSDINNKGFDFGTNQKNGDVGSRRTEQRSSNSEKDVDAEISRTPPRTHLDDSIKNKGLPPSPEKVVSFEPSITNPTVCNDCSNPCAEKHTCQSGNNCCCCCDNSKLNMNQFLQGLTSTSQSHTINVINFNVNYGNCGNNC